MKEYLLNWLKEHKELIGLFRFDTEQPGNLGSNRQLYNTLKNEFEYDVFYKIKKAICDYGFNVCYFNPKKILMNQG